MLQKLTNETKPNKINLSNDLGGWELVMPKFSNALVTKMRAIKKWQPALRQAGAGGKATRKLLNLRIEMLNNILKISFKLFFFQRYNYKYKTSKDEIKI